MANKLQITNYKYTGRSHSPKRYIGFGRTESAPKGRVLSAGARLSPAQRGPSARDRKAVRPFLVTILKMYLVNAIYLRQE